jgi:phage gpG-like protein
MFEVSIGGGAEVVAQLGELPQRMHDAILIKMVELEQRLIAKVVANLSGAVLKVKSGELRSSIRGEIVDDGAVISATVGSYGVEYARINEYGGKTRAHEILPSKAKALHFIYEGREVFAAIVHHPGSNVPARSYLNSALADMEDEITVGMVEAMVEATR